MTERQQAVSPAAQAPKKKAASKVKEKKSLKILNTMTKGISLKSESMEILQGQMQPLLASMKMGLYEIKMGTLIISPIFLAKQPMVSFKKMQMELE